MRSYIAAQANKGHDSLFKRTKLKKYSCPTIPVNSASVLSGNIAIDAYYQIKVPWYLDSYSRLYASLRYDLLLKFTDNEIENIPMSKMGEVNVLIQIPCSLVSSQSGIAKLQEFGHGIFEGINHLFFIVFRLNTYVHVYIDRSSAIGYWSHGGADYLNSPIWSMDWRGFSRFDLPLAARVLMYDFDALLELEASVYQVSNTAYWLILCILF
jgi:hypothetical protein